MRVQTNSEKIDYIPFSEGSVDFNTYLLNSDGHPKLCKKESCGRPPRPSTASRKSSSSVNNWRNFFMNAERDTLLVTDSFFMYVL